MQRATVNIPKMDIMKFYQAIKTHCKNAKDGCENCCMRLYCYTPPCEKTDSMMEKVISFLSIEHNHMESDNHPAHCNAPVQMPCPCSMDMSNALGYEPRR